MKKNNLISGALMLSVGSVLAKVFSAVYRIALTRILGGEGIGLYQLIFPFYSLPFHSLCFTKVLNYDVVKFIYFLLLPVFLMSYSRNCC